MATVILVGTLDTKGREYGFLRDQIIAAGCDVVLIDVGILADPTSEPTIDRHVVAEAAGTTIEALVAADDRGRAIAAMALGATRVVGQLHQEGRLHGVLGLGGSGGTALISEAMRGLPVGVPKLLVSTVASGDTRDYVGAVDIALMYSVVDISGLNRISTRILSNAAAAIAGMARSYADGLGQSQPMESDRPLIAATMFGVTTPCVTTAREWLESRGYEVLVFHATGTGGQSMEALVESGYIAGVLDITTTELADLLAGGIFSAGPDRLRQAGRQSIPQVVSLGALDMVNFGPVDTVPAMYADRELYVHNPAVTLMRTTPDECGELGRMVARALNESTGPTSVFVPSGGFSSISVLGGVFHDPIADDALIRALKRDLAEQIEVREFPEDINDARFAVAMATRLVEMIESSPATSRPPMPPR